MQSQRQQERWRTRGERIDPPAVEPAGALPLFGWCLESERLPVCHIARMSEWGRPLGVRQNRFFLTVPPYPTVEPPAEYVSALRRQFAPQLKAGVALLPCAGLFPRDLATRILDAGGGLRFSLLINDDDAQGRKTGLTLTPKGTEPYGHPEWDLDLILVPPQSAHRCQLSIVSLLSLHPLGGPRGPSRGLPAPACLPAGRRARATGRLSRQL